ncbi:hypothetical protein FS842_007166 [Serendipita sp. 407]|nr:hypothetical protein FS842_007166 [Serendipita sp. 407]
MNKADAGAWAAVSKVPREHLARSLLLLQLCRDLRVQEHDETNRGIIHQFVDEACSHINTLAVNARQCKETPDGNYFQEEWDQIWKLVHDLGPSIHPPEIFQKVREAQQKDSVIKDKLIDISGKIQRFKARLTAKDITILVAGPKLGMTIHEHISTCFKPVLGLKPSLSVEYRGKKKNTSTRFICGNNVLKTRHRWQVLRPLSCGWLGTRPKAGYMERQ